MSKSTRCSHVEHYREHTIYVMLDQLPATGLWKLSVEVRCPGGAWLRAHPGTQEFENST